MWNGAIDGLDHEFRPIHHLNALSNDNKNFLSMFHLYVDVRTLTLSAFCRQGKARTPGVGGKSFVGETPRGYFVPSFHFPTSSGLI